MKIRMTRIIILCCLFTELCSGQTGAGKNYSSLLGLMTPASKHPHYVQAKHNSNEIEMLVSGLFLAYKNFVSSQDGSSCSFTPSCSVYAIETIKKHGAFIGFLDAFDRLSRCNGIARDEYLTDPRSLLLIDPVQ